ncbi:NAD(P)H-dependent oxidoreductase [Persicobacter psychrovividus]|uniref:NAD(P)H-dependent oxidoreductase n=1 Tax=Persicobacter psychrovividus TaxID=387638 RepID=A0ABN6LAN0_9BACT|nr:NAD(P)H-dependent oxidoreductase [Persicobacter psychrovividus]
MDILDQLQWRYATKKFDSARKLEESQLRRILEGVRWSASSLGLQAWKIVVVETESLREEIKTHSWNQSQVTDASHLLILCRQEEVEATDVEEMVDLMANTRSVSTDSLTGYANMIHGYLKGLSAEQQAVWLDHQVYLALGNLLTVCAAEGVDACPIEGFAPAEIDRILDLPAEGLRSTVMCPIGFRDESDELAQQAKVRKPLSTIIIRK